MISTVVDSLSLSLSVNNKKCHQREEQRKSEGCFSWSAVTVVVVEVIVVVEVVVQEKK